ncbi:hypothetical protein [Nevskia ramosa]|uniref:hypothetical protein n=1 Tax=Nevskia ramosa TaxID=64002 RepID=UPI003D0BD0D4
MSLFRRHLESAPRIAAQQSEKPFGRNKVPAALLLTGLLPVLSGLQGCSSLTHYNSVRTVEAADGKKSEILLMDAKQRVVFPTTHQIRDSEGKVIDTIRAFCAEPSPDALSALAAQFGASVSIETKADVSANGGFAESAANIGLRTASIQTLRDSMYRQCEAFANGGMSRLSLETLQRRFQSTMVALLAIEQLTGAVRAPAVVLTSAAASNNADAVASLTTQTETARASLDTAVADVAAKEQASTTAADKAKTAADKAKADPKLQADADKAKAEADAAAKELATARTVASNRKEAFDSIDTSRRASLTAGGTATAGGTSTFAAAGQGLNAEAAKAVSTAVTDIVRDTLALGYGREVCTSIIGQSIEPDGSGTKMLAAGGSASSVRETCIELLKKDISYYASLESRLDSQTALTDSVASLIDRCTNDPKCTLVPDQVTRLIEALKPQQTVTAPLSAPLLK